MIGFLFWMCKRFCQIVKGFSFRAAGASCFTGSKLYRSSSAYIWIQSICLRNHSVSINKSCTSTLQASETSSVTCNPCRGISTRADTALACQDRLSNNFVHCQGNNLLKGYQINKMNVQLYKKQANAITKKLDFASGTWKYIKFRC